MSKDKTRQAFANFARACHDPKVRTKKINKYESRYKHTPK